MFWSPSGERGDVGPRDDRGGEGFVEGNNDCGFESFFLSFDLPHFDRLLGEAMETEELKETSGTWPSEFGTIVVDGDLKTGLTTGDAEEKRGLLGKSCFLTFFSAASAAIAALLAVLSCFFNTHNSFLFEDSLLGQLIDDVYPSTPWNCYTQASWRRRRDRLRVAQHLHEKENL